MQKETKYVFEKMNKDVAKSKHSNTLYFDAHNIRVMTNKEFGSITNEKGTAMSYTLPVIEVNPSNKVLNSTSFPISEYNIIHTEKVEEKVIIFTHTNNGTDVIFLLDTDVTPSITVLYIDNLGFTDDTYIESVGINENDQSQKVYWVDGENEIRFINIVDPNLINKEVSDISVNPKATLLDPRVSGSVDGGSHQSGVIQYAYNLYNQYGAETKVSGLSELTALQNGDQGNPLDAAITKSPVVTIDNIPQNFDYIKVYSIYYSSLNQVPRIALIYNNENISESLTITDSNDIIQEVTLNEFNILSNPSIIPKHVSNKDGHLFFGDYKTTKFDVEYDARAFSFEKAGSSWSNSYNHNDDKYNTLTLNSGISSAFGAFLSALPEDHDLIPSSRSLGYIFGTNTLGYSGRNVTVKIQYGGGIATSLKRGETYRIGVVLISDKDEESFVKWITDVRIPSAGELGYRGITEGGINLASLNVELKNLPEEVKSYRIVKVKRLDKDKTVKVQGFINQTLARTRPSIFEFLAGPTDADDLYPDWFQRTFSNDVSEPSIPLTLSGPNGYKYIRGESVQKPYNFDNDKKEVDINSNLQETQNSWIYKNLPKYFNLYSDTLLNNERLPNANYQLRYLGMSKLVNKTIRASFYTSYFPLNNTRLLSKTKYQLPITENKVFNYSFNNINREFLFQVDSPADSGTPPTFFTDRDFFRIENTDGNYFNLITPEIYTFPTTIDGTTVNVNRWEYKKIFNNTKFGEIFYSSGLVTPQISFLVDLFKPTYLQGDGFSTRLENVLLTDFFAGTTQRRTVTFNSTLSIENDTKFKTISNNSVIFESATLNQTLDDGFAALSTATKTDGTTNFHFTPIVELYTFLPNQYGGNNYASRQRNTYISMSEKQIKSATNIINTCYGDTYIGEIPILRVSEANSDYEGTISEIVTYIGESSINNRLRHDLIKNNNGNTTVDLQNSFLYNDVYQQESDLIKSLTKPFNFVEQNRFRSEIIATPKKQLGEFIDNWTKVSINDRITLDTEFGAVTGFAKLKDTLFAFQKDAIAYLAVNPRVQISTSDNIPIQLGSGKLIERYEYITTKSGSLHARSIVSTETGIFYYDLLNYSINRLTSQNEEVTLTKGLYNYFRDFSINHYDELDGTQLVSGFYHNDKEEIYFTFNTATEPFTVAYNLLSDGFSSFYSFVAPHYFDINNRMYSIPDNQNGIWEHQAGDNNYFYDVYYPSSITLIANEFPDNDKIFDGLTYIMDTENQLNEDETLVSFNEIKVDTSYQTSNNTPLVIGSNLRRKFRIFRIQLPREFGTRNRMRGQYALIKLTFNNQANNYSFICNDMIVNYTLS